MNERSKEQDEHLPAGPGVFLTTRWSRVVLAGASGGADAERALAELCRDYWYPLYHYARRSGFGAEDAEDLTQGFIGELLANQAIARADPRRGRFRTFLLGSFGHHIANFRRGQRTQKRGGGLQPVYVDAAAAEAELEQAAPDWMTPERHYEQSWAYALLDKVTSRLREEFEQAGRAALFDALQPTLAGAPGAAAYARTAEALGMTEGAVGVAAHRMRKRYGVLLREEIGATVASEEDVEDELRHLLQVVAGANSPDSM